MHSMASSICSHILNPPYKVLKEIKGEKSHLQEEGKNIDYNVVAECFCV